MSDERETVTLGASRYERVRETNVNLINFEIKIPGLYITKNSANLLPEKERHIMQVLMGF